MSNLAYDTEFDTGSVSERETSDMYALRPVPRISIQAFCETDGIAVPLERAGEDRRMARAHMKIHMGGIETAIDFYQTAPTPNLIIVESRSEPRQLLESLNRLAEYCDPTTKVVVIGHYNDVALYRDLMKSGVSEYMVAPISLADIIGVISTIFVDPEAEPIGRSLAFVGAKGGVGSSTIAHNVSWAMTNLFKSDVIVADMDLAFGTANIDFDQDPAQGIAEAVFSPERIDEVYLDRLLAQCSERLSLLAAPSTLDRVYDFDAEAFSHIIDTAQRTAPLVVLDIPHLWTGWSKQTLAQADEVVITAVPDLANLRNTKNLVDTLKKLRPNDAPPKLVINQSGVPKRAEISINDFVEPLGITPMAVIPFDPLLFGNAANNGRMLGEMDPKSPIVHAINEIAHVVTGRSEIKAKPRVGLSSLIGKLKLASKKS
ncbi:CpaE family protein [Pseudaminobacter sp. 19-2017]|uniref:CpaE family protein n=1 Tax=Pseudaminobacter soli (ex Zhang et al. 2022) TaxID=2831468 RepID=A0A942E537_9HYPH|nr:CpaE family protein [Pseudaminobacter soli]MBS3648642.1 CpaE family protein [Pseudaminobacter soli]